MDSSEKFIENVKTICKQIKTMNSKNYTIKLMVETTKIFWYLFIKLGFCAA